LNFIQSKNNTNAKTTNPTRTKSPSLLNRQINS